MLSDSSGTCVSLPFSTFLQTFSYQRCLLENIIIIIILILKRICSCFISLSLPLESLFSVCDIKIFVVRMFVNSKIEEYYISQENSSKSWRTFKGALILGFDVNCFFLNKIIWWPIGLLAITSLAGMFNFPKLQWFSMKWSEITHDLNFHTKINHANISRSSGTDSLIKFFFECGSCQVGIKTN